MYRYSSTLSLTSALGEGGWLAPLPCRFTPGNDPVRIVQEAGWTPGPVWTGAEVVAPTEIRSPDRPACSESLYRLRCPSSPSFTDLPLTLIPPPPPPPPSSSSSSLSLSSSFPYPPSRHCRDITSFIKLVIRTRMRRLYFKILHKVSRSIYIPAKGSDASHQQAACRSGSPLHISAP